MSNPIALEIVAMPDNVVPINRRYAKAGRPSKEARDQIWRGAPQLRKEPPAYSPMTAGDLEECLRDLQQFCAETWSNYAIQKRLDDLAGHLVPALGVAHPIVRRLNAAAYWVPRIDKQERITRRLDRLRSFIAATLHPETNIDPACASKTYQRRKM